MNRTTLNKATSPDPSPTPGYLFDEIAKVTHDPIGNDRLVEYLLKRLDSPSADVKAKVLNIIKHVCRKGNASFRRAWQREAGAIKAHLQFHTAPDPLRGDEPSKRVRENAKEALEAVFDASRDERKTDPALAGRIQGFGVSPAPAPAGGSSGNPEFTSPNMPTAYASPAYSSSAPSAAPTGSRFSASSRYEGIGNPAFQDPRNQPKGLLERVADVVREKVEKQAETIPGIGGVRPPWMTPGAVNAPSGYAFATNRGTSSPYAASSTGSYDPTLAQRTSNAADPVWSDPRSPRPVAAQPVTNGSGSRQIRTSERSDGAYEQSVVNELCAPGGVRPIPPKEQLDGFCKACRTLDPAWIIHFLNEKLQDDDWKVQHKGLCVLEALLQTPGLDSFADQLDQTPDNLESLYNSKNPSLKERAQKVWRTLYEDEDSKAGGVSQSTRGEADLIGEIQGAPLQFQQSSTAATNVNLLDFDAEATGRNMLDSFSQPAKPATPTPAGLPNMFQNLSVKGSSAGAKPAIPSPTAPLNQASTPAASSGFSFLGNGTAAVSTSKTPVNLMDMQMPTSTTRPVQSSSMDLFSIPLGSAPAMSSSSGSSSMLPFIQQSAAPSPQGFPSKPMMTGSFSAQQQAPAKKPDSFNFVQEALQSSKKV